MENPVGPILRMGAPVERVVSAIEDDNPGVDIEVIDRGPTSASRPPLS